MCGEITFSAHEGYLTSPNFPTKYPPNITCDCSLSSADGSNMKLDIIYLAIKFDSPCNDWLKVGNKKICGFSTSNYEGSSFDIQFHSDGVDDHSGYWLYFEGKEMR